MVGLFYAIPYDGCVYIGETDKTSRSNKEKVKEIKIMNTNTMELNLDELEMISGGDVWDRVKGTLIGAGIGCVSGAICGVVTAGPVGAAAGGVTGAAAGAIVGETAGYEKMKEKMEKAVVYTLSIIN